MAIPKRMNRAAREKVSARKYGNQVTSVPPMSIARQYRNRELFAPGRTDFEVFDMARSDAMNVLIEGPTGAGKTMAVKAYAAARELPFYAIPCNAGVAPEELVGSFVPNPDTGKFEFVPGGLADIIKHGGVLLINEINFLPERVAVIMFEVLDGRRSVTMKHVMSAEEHVILAHRPDCWCSLPSDECEAMWPLIVADLNPGYQGTRELNSALRNRFPIKLDWGYDGYVEQQLVRMPSLLRMADKVRTTTAQQMTYSEPIGTNVLMEFERIALKLGLEAAMKNFVNAMVRPDERHTLSQICKTFEQNLREDLAVLDPNHDPATDIEDPLYVDEDEDEFDDDTWK